MANKYIKIYPTLLVTKEMQIKTIARYHMLEWLVSKRQEITGCGEKGILLNFNTLHLPVVGLQIDAATMENSRVIPQKN